MKNFSLLIVLIITLSFVSIHAQLYINAEIHPRAEMRYGYKQLSDTISSPAFLISQRSRLGLGFTMEKYSLYFAIQDVRVWGDEQYYSSTGIRGDQASVDLKEAWAEYSFSDQFSLRLGRQQLKYADQRLLSGRNWNQYGMSYDAILLKYKGDFVCDAGFSYNNNKEIVYQETYSLDKMKTMNFVYLKKQWNENIESSFIYVLSGFQKPDKVEGIYFKHTPGIILKFSLQDFTFNGSGYYQFGQNNIGADVSAYFWNLKSEYSLPHVTFAAGIDFLSGQNFASSDSSYLKKDHLFDLLYGSRHRYYGNMDHFSNIPKGTAGGGLIDIYLDAQINVSDKLYFKPTYHYLRLQNNVMDPDSPGLPSTLDKSLAHELDFMLSYKPAKDFKIEMGYAFLISAKSLNKIQNLASEQAIDAHWLWIMCIITPSMSFEKKKAD